MREREYDRVLKAAICFLFQPNIDHHMHDEDSRLAFWHKNERKAVRSWSYMSQGESGKYKYGWKIGKGIRFHDTTKH